MNNIIKCEKCGVTNKDEIVYKTKDGNICRNCCYNMRLLDKQKDWILSSCH